MLWVYADNDHFFGPKLAQKLKVAFTGGGATVEFVSAPAFGSDGHRLFSATGISEWSGAVHSFLQHHGLAMRMTLLPPPPLPALTAPAALSANDRRAFETYLMSPPHKVFALAPDGHFGWQSSVRTTEAAKNRALQFCQQGANNCDVMFVDDAPVSKDSPRDN